MYVITKKQARTRDKYKKKGTLSNKILIYTLIFLLFSAFFAFNDNITKAGNSTSDIKAMIYPVQIPLYPQISFIQDMNGVETTFTKLAKYTIAGRVVEEHDYSKPMTDFLELVAGKTYYNEIASKDIAISFGPLALEKNHKKMTYIMTGTRRISYAVNDPSIYNELGDINEVRTYVTNNHLIPANSDIEKLIQKISKDDYVQITGYLIDAVWQNKNNKYAISSSLSRYDTGNNACEVLYVEDVKWIK